MSEKSEKVNQYISKKTQWSEELEMLREIALGTPLSEDIKWNAPCYTYDSKNILSIGGFKDYCFMSFFQGVLLKDKKKILVSPGENSKIFRMARYTDTELIQKQKSILYDYILEAIDISKSGKKIPKPDPSEMPTTPELGEYMKQDKAFAKAFKALTPGRQRGYIMFIDAAKQSSTRIRRIEKYHQRILDGYGMNDCVCGLSKRMPSCDGSHKELKTE